MSAAAAWRAGSRESRARRRGEPSENPTRGTDDWEDRYLPCAIKIMLHSAGRVAPNHRFRRYLGPHGGPNAGGAAWSPVGLRIDMFSNSKDGTTYVAIAGTKALWNLPGIMAITANIPPPRGPPPVRVVTMRERDAATISLKEAIVTPASVAPRIGSSCPSAKSFTASASGIAPPPSPDRIAAMTATKPLGPAPAPPNRRTTIA